MCDCKTCKHGDVLYSRDRKDISAPMKAHAWIMCYSPKYNGGSYPVKVKSGCRYFGERERKGGK